MAERNWRTEVIRHARATGAAGLPAHTVDELAAHLEDIYLDAIRSRPERGRGRAAGGGQARTNRRSAAVPVVAHPGAGVAADQRAVAARGLTGLAGDVRLAWRQWRRAPSFAAIAILTLGLGAGAATAIFSIVDTVLLRPLPFHAPEAAGLDLGEQRREGAAARTAVPGQLHGLPGRPRRVRRRRGLVAARDQPRRAGHASRSASTPSKPAATCSSCSAYPPRSGRDFRRTGRSTRGTDRRDQRSAVAAALQRRPRRSSAGRIKVNEGQYTIAGVMPPAFNFPDDVDLWLRLQWDLTRHSRGAHFMERSRASSPA